MVLFEFFSCFLVSIVDRSLAFFLENKIAWFRILYLSQSQMTFCLTNHHFPLFSKGKYFVLIHFIEACWHCSTDANMVIIFIRSRAIFSQPFAGILVRFVLPHFWLYLFVGFHDTYFIKTFRTAYLVVLEKTRPTSTRCTVQVSFSTRWSNGRQAVPLKWGIIVRYGS